MFKLNTLSSISFYDIEYSINITKAMMLKDGAFTKFMVMLYVYEIILYHNMVDHKIVGKELLTKEYTIKQFLILLRIILIKVIST